MADKTPILFPGGRMVQGDLYEPGDKDADGNPLLVKNGANKGQARVEYYFAVAIPKTGQPWWETEWGKTIYQVGLAAFPQAAQTAGFAWKVKDGDDAQPRLGKGGKPGKPYNQREGWAGHWIIPFSSGYAPKIVDANGTSEITTPGAVKCGYWVQVYGNVSGNGSSQRPGVFVNPNGVALSGYDKEIASGVDLSNVGFGGALPPGVSATPIGGMTTMPPQQPAAPAANFMPGMPQQAPVGFPNGYPQPGQVAGFPGAPGAAVGAYPVPGAVPGHPGAHPMPVPAGAVPGMPTQGYGPHGVGAQVAQPGVPQGVPVIPGVQPNPAFLQVPGTPTVPAAPVAPVAAPVRQMTAAANGASYESFIQAGWNDALLVANGYMLA